MNSFSLFARVAVFAVAITGCSAGKDAAQSTDLGGEDVGDTSAADTLGKPASTLAIKFGDIKTASFTRSSKYRAFEFEGQKDQVVNAYVDGLNGLDTVAYLYRVSKTTGRPYGSPIAQNDDTESADWTLRSNATHNELSSNFEVRLPETRKYALVTTTYEQGYTGKAEVTVKSPATAPAIETVTTAQLTANPSAYAGKRVSVTDEVDASRTMCTKMACSPSNPCCNACSAGFRLGASDITVANIDPTSRWGCSGNSCSLTCTGFPSQQPGKYTLVGLFTVDLSGALQLAVESKTAANCHTSGCSGNLCANTDRISTCEYRPEYACYAKHSTCGVISGGECGWAQTAGLITCLGQ